jgi:hypothetical protein
LRAEIFFEGVKHTRRIEYDDLSLDGKLVYNTLLFRSHYA